MKTTQPLLAHDYVRSDHMGPDYLAKKFARMWREIEKKSQLSAKVAPIKKLRSA